MRSVTWMSMLFEGGNPSLIPNYCQVETDYKQSTLSIYLKYKYFT